MLLLNKYNAVLFNSLIEFRKLDWLKYILYQIAHLYGNTDASLYIVHGSKNGNYFKNILNGWSNITFIEYPNDNLNRRQYAELCTNPEFYKCFKTKFVLKMEWDSFIRKQIQAQQAFEILSEGHKQKKISKVANV